MSMTVNEASVKYVRDNFAEVLDRVAIGKEVFLVTKFGKKRVYILPADEVEYAPKSSELLKNDNEKLTKNKDNNLSKFYGIWKDHKEIKKYGTLGFAKKLRKKSSSRLNSK